MSVQDKLIKAMGLISEALGELSMGDYQPQYTTTSSSEQPVAEPDRSHEEGSGPVLAKTGHRCYCSVCKDDHYEVVAPVYGRDMGVAAFLGAFKPLSSARPLTREDLERVLRDKYGNTMIDCPVCKGESSLTLIGEVDRTAQKLDHDNPVGSIDGEVLGL